LIDATFENKLFILLIRQSKSAVNWKRFIETELVQVLSEI